MRVELTEAHTLLNGIRMLQAQKTAVQDSFAEQTGWEAGKNSDAMSYPQKTPEQRRIAALRIKAEAAELKESGGDGKKEYHEARAEKAKVVGELAQEIRNA